MEKWKKGKWWSKIFVLRSYWLLVIFLLALLLRLMYFPGNVYFASDQARDAYYSYDVLGGDLKVVGPGMTFSKYLYHGVLYYYVMGPVYFLSRGSPYIPALIINFLNAAGVFVVYLIGRNIFNKKIGLIAAFLYAISFEQSQYALFFGHPGLALIFVLLYYLGLTWVIFKGNSRGLILSAFCAGLATQLHLSLAVLIVCIPIFMIVFRSSFVKMKYRDVFFALTALVVSMSTFVVAEVKYKHLRLFISNLGEPGASNFGIHLDNFLFAVNRYVTDNLIIIRWVPMIGLLFAVLILGFLILNRKERKAGIFLAIWFFAGCVAYIISSATTYYYGIGGSVGLVISAAAVIGIIWKKKPVLAVGIIAAVAVSNIFQITTINRKGPIDSVMAPTGLLLADETDAIDYIYSQAGAEEFSVHALTIPYNVKTTWDYLFNWYGMQKYGFVPVWGGEDALGSEGTLEVVSARSVLPTKQFLILEPLTGLQGKVVEDFFREESYFTNLVSEKKFGEITVQIREKY